MFFRFLLVCAIQDSRSVRYRVSGFAKRFLAARGRGTGGDPVNIRIASWGCIIESEIVFNCRLNNRFNQIVAAYAKPHRPFLEFFFCVKRCWEFDFLVIHLRES